MVKNTRKIFGKRKYVSVKAPARLHLGFLDMRGDLGRKFGSLGLSVTNVETSITATYADDIDISGIFLEKAAQLVKEAAGSIVNVDATLIAEAPKILPHVPAMKEAVAKALAIPTDRVGIKATTNELLGFLGRGEGMAGMAVAGVNLPD